MEHVSPGRLPVWVLSKLKLTGGRDLRQFYYMHG
jgi:hypothetical protein